MKCRRKPLIAEVIKYELNKNLEDGFRTYTEVVTDGVTNLKNIIKIQRNSTTLCPYITDRRGYIILKEDDYIIIDEDGTKHVCGEDKIWSRYEIINE